MHFKKSRTRNFKKEETGKTIYNNLLFEGK